MWRPHQFIGIPGEFQLDALITGCITVLTQTIERIPARDTDTIVAAHGRELASEYPHASVMEIVIGEQRAVVAVNALPLVQEQIEASQFGGVQLSIAGSLFALGDRIGVVVEARTSGLQFSLVRGDRLTDIRKYPVDGLPLCSVQCIPACDECLSTQGRGDAFTGEWWCQAKYFLVNRPVGLIASNQPGPRSICRYRVHEALPAAARACAHWLSLRPSQ